MRLGVLGGGQLGWMLGRAADPLGLRLRFWDGSAHPPAARAGELFSAPFEATERVGDFVAGLDLVTYEFESVPVATVEAVARHVPVAPGVRALATAQDRLFEKELFASLGIAVAPHAPVSDRASLDDALARVGTPGILKTRRFGYDGKGQHRIATPADADAAWAALGGVPLVYEGLVRFERECSALVARSATGETASYPLMENVHAGGILRTSHLLLPEHPTSARLAAKAAEHAARVAEALDYVGVLALELFDTPEGLVANELAPRVHNSGHHTIEACHTSQFENHLRAVAGLPLGDPSPLCHSAMVNVIGVEPAPSAVLAVPGAHLHRYGKSPAPGRKLGHVTVTAPSAERLAERVRAVNAAIDSAQAPGRA